MAENLKMRFSDFCSHATDILIFENRVSIVVSDASGRLQFALSEMKYYLIFV
jgi:hypothetical protein